METCDVLIVGAGIAGASAAYALARQHRVILLEREAQPGYHTTGRSAAMFTETYGNATIRRLTMASRDFFDSPPAGFANQALVKPRGELMIARSHRLAALERAFAEAHALLPSVRRLGPAEAQAMVPVLRAEHVAGAMYQPDAKDIDVDALHRGYLAATKAAGGRLVTSVEIRGLIRDGGHWHAQTNAGDFAAKFVINAAGAWCDELAKLAGIAPIGLVPKRRTVITFDPPPGIDIAAWPIVIDVDETYYFKPEAGRLLATPADETPMPACDVQPDELDIALTVERVEAASSLKIRRIVSKWAGLRSFVADKTLVAGFEPGAPGFFWLAGQGGYGIQTSPAMSQIVAALIEGRPFPSDLVDLGLSPDLLAPARLRAV